MGVRVRLETGVPRFRRDFKGDSDQGRSVKIGLSRASWFGGGVRDVPLLVECLGLTFNSDISQG